MRKTLIFALLLFSLFNSFAQNNPLSNAIQLKDSKFLVNVTGGFSWRVAEIAPNLDNFQKAVLDDLMSGKSFDISAYYKPKNSGFGLKYNSFMSSSSKTGANITMINGETYQDADYNVDNSIYFIGPSVYVESKNPNNPMSKHQGMIEFALGYLGYNDVVNVSNNKYIIKSATFGILGSFGYRYCFTNHFSLGPQISIVGGVLKKLNIDGPNNFNREINLNKDSYENLLRVDLSVGATFRF